MPTSNNVIPLDRTPETVKVDNLLRRILKVRDPSDPAQIAKALLSRYTSEAQNLQFEREGLPFQNVVAPTPVSQVSAGGASYQPEIRQALDDLEYDLRELLTSNQLKDVVSELQGWARAIRSAAADGLDAARMALDSRQRDRALSARRILGDYARLARYVGSLSGTAKVAYRQLAQSIDVLAGLTLVVMGDAFAMGGVTRGTLVLQAPASELVERRDHALLALRNLVDGTGHYIDPKEWPRGQVAYQALLNRLNASGQADLRALLEESTLAKVFDELIDLAAGNTPDGLRALGATAGISLQRLRRLIAAAIDATQDQEDQVRVNPESPQLAAFVAALITFSDGFQYGRSGTRLLFISRPPLIFYGLYGAGGPDSATRLLLAMLTSRGIIAERIDCLGCSCDADQTLCQIVLDKLLYDIDRAIDLYAMGSDEDAEGEAEHRAAAYGALIDAVITAQTVRIKDCLALDAEIKNHLVAMQALLGWTNRFVSVAEKTEEIGLQLHDELSAQQFAEERFRQLAQVMAPNCMSGKLDIEIDLGGVTRRFPVIEGLLEVALANIRTHFGFVVVARAAPELSFRIPPSLETSVDSFVTGVRANGALPSP